MCAARVAAVSRDQQTRLELARAFDVAPATWQVSLHTEMPADVDVAVFGPDVPHEGGIVFDPNDPAGLIEDIEAALAADDPGKVFVVTGTGGGVGVTTVTLHLAMNAARDRTTCCVGDRRTSMRLDLPLDIPQWPGAEGGADTLAAPVAGGFRVLLTASDPASAVAAASESFDAVFVDAPGCDADTLAAARAAVLVLPPTVPGARTALEIVNAFPNVRWALVTNRLGPGGEMTRVALERIVERRIAVELPTCAPLRDAEDDGVLLTSVWYRWPRKVAQLWATLENS